MAADEEPWVPPPVVIPARAKSDDHIYDIPFDAEKWFAQANDKEVRDLAECGWGGDYPADEVAMFMAGHDDQLPDLFKYLEKIANIKSKKDVSGFECHVDEDKAMEWLKHHKIYLFRQITYMKSQKKLGIDPLSDVIEDQNVPDSPDEE